MANRVTSELGAVIDRLQRERQDHLSAIEQIDAIFNRYGIRIPAAGRRGRAAASKAASGRGRRTRRRFKTSGPQSLLNYVRSAGKNGATSSELSKHWKSEGRAGEPYVALSLLVDSKKLKKQKLPHGRGSRYTLL